MSQNTPGKSSMLYWHLQYTTAASRLTAARVELAQVRLLAKQARSYRADASDLRREIQRLKWSRFWWRQVCAMLALLFAIVAGVCVAAIFLNAK